MTEYELEKHKRQRNAEYARHDALKAAKQRPPMTDVPQDEPRERPALSLSTLVIAWVLILPAFLLFARACTSS